MTTVDTQRFVDTPPRSRNEALASLMRRFRICEERGFTGKNIATASRLLGEAVDAGLIVIADPTVGTRIRSYLPYWAAPGPDSGEIA